MSAINVNSITGRTGSHGPVLTGVTTVSGSSLVVIGTGASIGIGTSAPDAPLHVATAPNKATIAIFGSTDETSGSTYQALAIKNDVASYPALANVSSTDTLDLRSAGSVQVTIDANNNDTTKFFRVTANDEGGSGTELFRVDEDGNAGIGTDDPKAQTWRNGTALDVHGGSGSVVGNLHIGADRGDGVQTVGSLVFYDNTQDTNHKVISIIESDKTGSTSNQRGGTVKILVKEDAEVSNSAVESVTFTKDGISIPSGNGIDFQNTGVGNSTTATSHLLDDYEEGTFTPGLRGDDTAGSPTYSRNQGAYVKVGRLVTCFAYIAITNKGGMVGDINITGLPFNVADILPNTGVDGGGLLHYYAGISDSDITRITVLPDDQTSTADFFFGKTGVSMGALQEDDIADNFNFRAFFAYHT